MGRKQDENLIPNAARTPSELREITRKGGIASGKARREKKALRETMQELLTMRLKDKKLLEKLAALGFTAKGITMQDAITAAMIQQAAQGNVNAFKEIRETIAPTKEEEAAGGDNRIKITLSIEDMSGGDDAEN